MTFRFLQRRSDSSHKYDTVGGVPAHDARSRLRRRSDLAYTGVDFNHSSGMILP
jgi:hypothetical protein